MASFSRSLVVLALAFLSLAAATPTATIREKALKSRGDGGDGNGDSGHNEGGHGGPKHHPRPAPSHRPVYEPERRSLDSMTASEIAFEICPSIFHGCPIAKAGSKSILPASFSAWMSEGFECVDFTADLRACGGCASTDARHDCTIIPGAYEVACIEGSCAIDSCLTGYTLDSTKKTCVGK